jgi:hypothetical protein
VRMGNENFVPNRHAMATHGVPLADCVAAPYTLLFVNSPLNCRWSMILVGCMLMHNHPSKPCLCSLTKALHTSHRYHGGRAEAPWGPVAEESL